MMFETFFSCQPYKSMLSEIFHWENILQKGNDIFLHIMGTAVSHDLQMLNRSSMIDDGGMGVRHFHSRHRFVLSGWWFVTHCGPLGVERTHLYRSPEQFNVLLRTNAGSLLLVGCRTHFLQSR